MKPGRCTLLLSIFILTFLRVSGKYMPIIRKTYCIYVTLVFCTLYAWLSGLFRATMCPSSGKHTVSMRHWYFALCMGGCLVCFGQLCAHYQEKILYLCDTDIFHSVWVAVWSADQTATHYFFFLWRCGPKRAMASSFIHEVSRSHTTTHHSR